MSALGHQQWIEIAGVMAVVVIVACLAAAIVANAIFKKDGGE